jgi:hypothetical protein
LLDCLFKRRALVAGHYSAQVLEAAFQLYRLTSEPLVVFGLHEQFVVTLGRHIELFNRE